MHHGRATGELAREPVLQHRREVTDLEEVVFRVAQFRCRAREHRARVLEIGRRVRRTAVLAVVAVLVRRAAVRADALDVAVGQEHLPQWVVQLADRTRGDVAAGLEARIDEFGELAVFRRVRRVVAVVRDAEVGKIVLVARLHVLDEGLGRHARLLCREHDRRAMHVVGGDEMHRVARHAPRAHPDVRLDVAEQVADVQRAIRIGQGVGDEDRLRRGGVRRIHCVAVSVRCCKAEL